MINSELGLLRQKQIGKMRLGTLENVYMEMITMSVSGRKNPVLRIVADIVERKEKRKMFDRAGKLAMAGKEN